MKIHSKFIASIAGLLAGGLITGCSDPTYQAPVPATAATTETANVLMVHASPDAASLTPLLNNAAGNAIVYPGASAYAATGQVGSQQLGAGAASGTIGGTLGTATAVRLQATLVNNTYYTIFVTDSINRPKAGTDIGGPRLLQITDNLAAPAAGFSKIRFFNLAPGATAYFLTLSANGTDFPLSRSYRATSSGTTTFANFISKAIGTYDLQLRTGSVTGTIVATVTGQVLADGKIYTIIARGRPGIAGQFNTKTGTQAPGLTVVANN